MSMPNCRPRLACFLLPLLLFLSAALAAPSPVRHEVPAAANATATARASHELTQPLAAGSSGLYKALADSILFFEGQRSGKLPVQRVRWRANSGLTDGRAAGLDLSGGYYDAGDNVKFVWTIAHTVTMLSWSAIEYSRQLTAAGEYRHAVEAIEWGSTFLLKAAVAPTRLVTQVGDGNSDHACWERPEDMDTPRTVLQITESSPGTEVAADTAAALAAASLVFKQFNPRYAARLVRVAKQMFSFANQHRGSYSGSCPFYCSFSGYNDELLWGATWLYKATSLREYLNFVTDNVGLSTQVTEFSWDNKFAGVQILLSKEYLSNGHVSLSQYNDQARSFVCAVLSSSRTPGGLHFVRDSYNLEYVTGASFITVVYADYIGRGSLTCGGKTYRASDLVAFSKSQVDYILGSNPLGVSYMVGYGKKYPQQLHHRGASITSTHDLRGKVGCSQGYTRFFNRNSPNPNTHVGAIVGGPDQSDRYSDKRDNFNQNEPAIYINAPFVGLAARLL